jgi:pimeloyl-ACP methyl ester carboxylesterase
LAQYPTDWGAFQQVIDAKPLAGKKFRLEAAVKVKLIDTTAEAELWVRVDRRKGKTGFFDNMTDRPIRNPTWQVYQIVGQIDRDAEHLVFGGLYARQGQFFFDDFKLWVEGPAGQYMPVPVPNGSFEDATLAPVWTAYQERKGLERGLVQTGAFAGAQACRVDGAQAGGRSTFGRDARVGRYAPVNGINIYYEIYGQGPPLLLLHGNSQSIASFALQIPELAAHYQVIAVDTRGQGRSSENGRPYTYDLFAEDMNALLDHLRLDSARVVGWSDGGNTGLIMAMRYPAKVKKLVAMGANVFIDQSVVSSQIFKTLRRELRQTANDTSYAARNNARLVKLLLTEPRHTFAELAAVSCPVLVMAGEKDIIKPGHTQGIAAHLRRGTLRIVPNETHDYPRENPEGFNQAVLDFLRD